HPGAGAHGAALGGRGWGRALRASRRACPGRATAAPALSGRLIVAPARAGRATAAPALAGRLIVAPARAGRHIVAPALAGRLIVAPARAGRHIVAPALAGRLVIILLTRVRALQVRALVRLDLIERDAEIPR